MGNKTKYTREFKLKILRELNHKPLSELSREYNIHHSSICRWRNEYNESPKKAFSGNGNLWKKDAEIAKLQRLIGQLYAENELLKKAIDNLKEKQAEERILRSTK